MGSLFKDRKNAYRGSRQCQKLEKKLGISASANRRGRQVIDKNETRKEG